MSRKQRGGGGNVSAPTNTATGTALEFTDNQTDNTALNNNENKNTIPKEEKNNNDDELIMINDKKRQLTRDSENNNRGKGDEIQTGVIKEEFGKEEPRRRRGNDELDPDEQAIVDLCNTCAQCCIVF